MSLSSSITFYLKFFEMESVTEPGAYCFGSVGWWISSGELFITNSRPGVTRLCYHAQLLHMFRGSELRSSCLHSEYFIH